MNTRSTLNNAILNFAFTGVMQPHETDGTGAYARLAEFVSAARTRAFVRARRSLTKP